MNRLVCMTCVRTKGYKLAVPGWQAHGKCQKCGDVAPLYKTVPECAVCEDDDAPLTACVYCEQPLCKHCTTRQEDEGGCPEDPDRGLDSHALYRRDNPDRLFM